MNDSIIIEEYSKGFSLGIIAENLECDIKEVEEYLLDLKNHSKEGRSFNNEYKTMIANREKRGVSRRKSSKELGINPNTVKNACNEIGLNPPKESDSSGEQEERHDIIISGEIDKNCVFCDSRRVSKVDKKIVFCIDCNSEYKVYDDHVMKTNWEYI